MRVRDIMTVEVVTVSPNTRVEDIAKLLLERRISAVPVVDAKGKVLGIVSEGDLMRRPELETERKRSWWLQLLSDNEQLATDYVKTHGLRAEQVMTKDVVSATEDTPVGEVARILEARKIKRLPVMRGGKLVGIVSRANLLQGLAVHREKLTAPVTVDDRTLRERILATLREHRLTAHTPNVIVADGKVDLWAWVDSDQEKQALALAVERIPGVRSVETHIAVVPLHGRAT